MEKKYIIIFICMLLISITIMSVIGYQEPEEEPNFIGVDESIFEEANRIKPPDPIIAAGPEYLVVMTNGAICVFEKDGTWVNQMDIRNPPGIEDSFWKSEGASGEVWDPWVIYDPDSNRFIASAIDRYDNDILLAVTLNSNPSDFRTDYGWYKWKIDISGEGQVDFAKIGVDCQAVYVSSSDHYGGDHLICIFEKELLLNGEEIGAGDFKTMPIEDTSFWGVPIMYEDDDGAPAMYFINTSLGNNQNQIRINALMDPLGEEPYFADPVDLDVESYSEPPYPAPQKGTDDSHIQTKFHCFRFCTWRDGSLWAAHHYGTSTKTIVRWYEIETKGWPTSNNAPEIHQWGEIPDPEEEEDFWTFYPAITPDGYGNAAICFGRSSEDEYPSIQYCYRLLDDDLGTMREMTEIKVSNTYYSPQAGGPPPQGHRWGDYYGISCDISDNRSFWMHGEYTDDDGEGYGEYWKTWVSRFTPTVNTKPGAPNIEGETGGTTGETYYYTFVSTDPDGDKVRYIIDWDDLNPKEITKFYPSDEEVEVSHTWYDDGTYYIEARAEDIYGSQSAKKIFIVKMPRNNIVGYNLSGVYNQNIKDKISGTCFTMTANGIADNINVYVQTNPEISPKTKCMIYSNEGSALIGVTEEKILNTVEDGAWITYNFSEPKPKLYIDTEYILVCWSNETCNLSYDIITSESGRYGNQTYGCPFSPMSWNGSESRNYSIYCKYTTKPEISNVSAAPGTVGFGYNITISADINDNGCGTDNVAVNITYPNNTSGNFTMNNTGNNTYEYVFSDTWRKGQYNYTIWARDKSLSTNCSLEYSFNVSGQATISVCTIKDNYGNNETINLTDPPPESPLIGYELLDNSNVLHIWNKYDSYYFDTNRGMQLTNHYDEYWSHNVLMLGYYNNDLWNLIYRTDELSGFNKNIDTDYKTYVNATLWKDLTYAGYNFRLAIRYHLGLNDNELTIIPYIKNLGQGIPYTLGFGWEMKDIQIDMTPEDNYINVNHTIYYLNQDLNNVYTYLTEAEFYLMENTTDTSTKSLYLKWNPSLNYKLQVKSREGQYNAPVTLFIKIGTLSAGQEKYTEIYWYDADQVTYYFDSYDDSPFGESWATNPGNMVDGNIYSYALTTLNGDVELCDSNNCSGADYGTISKVEMRICSYYTGYIRDTILRPVFGGTTDGNNHPYQTPIVSGIWSPWFEITRDNNAPDPWSWIDIQNLDCDIVAENDPMAPSFTLYCSKAELRVTYVPYSPPEITNPYPPNNGNGIPITPTLNITVSDATGESMNITWFTNSSGSWQVFGTNNSIGNGTYHQTMNNASVNGQWWYWKLNVTDGTNYTESSVFRFYTGYQSKIVNTGSTDIKGYLQMQVQYYNTSSSSWVVADYTINETTMRTINASEQFGLDTIFNGLVNTNNLSGFGNGTYRIYVAFRDSDGNVLVCDNENELIATYEFTVTFD